MFNSLVISYVPPVASFPCLCLTSTIQQLSSTARKNNFSSSLNSPCFANRFRPFRFVVTLAFSYAQQMLLINNFNIFININQVPRHFSLSFSIAPPLIIRSISLLFNSSVEKPCETHGKRIPFITYRDTFAFSCSDEMIVIMFIDLFEEGILTFSIITFKAFFFFQ